MDTTGLYASADRVDDLAELLRARAARIELQAVTAQWHSPAARAFFAHLDDVSSSLTGCVTRLHDFAALMRTCARR
jgi:hypothetical protein